MSTRALSVGVRHRRALASARHSVAVNATSVATEVRDYLRGLFVGAQAEATPTPKRKRK